MEFFDITKQGRFTNTPEGESLTELNGVKDYSMEKGHL